MPPPRIRNPCSYLPRRLQIVASLTIFVLLSFLFLGASSQSEPYIAQIPYGPQIQDSAHHVVEQLPKLPQPAWLNPFRTPAHKPPPEQEDSHGAEETSWFSDFKWRNPFSHTVTQDDRLVLPPLKERPVVYTYYDMAGRRKDEKSKQAEQDLLLIWRRAWWAQGFKPVILSSAEAMNNPLYSQMLKMALEPEMKMEMMRWLAWGNMGTGILCNWLAVPMGSYDDPLLAFLRKGEYPNLTRYRELETGLYVGMKDHVAKALRIALESTTLSHAKTMPEAVPREAFKAEDNSDSIAFYSSATIKSTYKLIQSKLEMEDTRAEGLAMLPFLINSHLHMTWQNTFTKGIAVLKPVAQNTTSMVEPAIDIARNLTQCAASPMPSSCPPNNVRCRPCVSSQAMTIFTPPIVRNTSTLFTIGTIPHPYTLQSLIHTNDEIDVRFLRRKTKRDVFIMAATKELLGTGISSFARLGPLKDAIASEYGASHSLWLTAEEPIYLRTEKDMQELDWLFGFEIPRAPLASGKSVTPVPGPERRPPPPKQEYEGPAPSEKQLAMQRALVESSRLAVRKATKKEAVTLRSSVEAWNLADTEAWRFVRAFNARRQVERRNFENAEDSFLGKGHLERWKEKVAG